MSKEQVLVHYRTALSVFRKWFAEGVITEEELLKIDALVAEKYGLPPRSIHRESLDITGV